MTMNKQEGNGDTDDTTTTTTTTNGVINDGDADEEEEEDNELSEESMRALKREAEGKNLRKSKSKTMRYFQLGSSETSNVDNGGGGNDDGNRGNGTFNTMQGPGPEQDLSTKCFRCHRVGHIAKDCPFEAAPVPCFICGLTDHMARRCPSAVCLRCGERGHEQRYCPVPEYKLKARDKDIITRDKSATRRNGMHSSHVDIEHQHDLEKVRCLFCGEVGHVNCQVVWVTTDSAVVYCCLCGSSGHTADRCGAFQKRGRSSAQSRPALDNSYAGGRGRKRGRGGVGGGRSQGYDNNDNDNDNDNDDTYEDYDDDDDEDEDDEEGYNFLGRSSSSRSRSSSSRGSYSSNGQFKKNPHQEKTCYSCGQVGHISAACPRTRKGESTNNSSNSSSSFKRKFPYSTSSNFQEEKRRRNMKSRLGQMASSFRNKAFKRFKKR